MPDPPCASHTDLISTALRERLDAARDWLHFRIAFIHTGTPRSAGRLFGCWEVTYGRDGWQRQPGHEHLPGTGGGYALYPSIPLPPGHIPSNTVYGAKFDTLETVLSRAIDSAVQSWPE